MGRRCALAVFSPPAVTSLFQARCPSAIVKTVVSIIIDSVNTVGRGRSRPHVSKKLTEVVPSFAHCNTATAVVSIMHGSRVHAAALHCSPNPVLRSVDSAMFQSLLDAPAASQAPILKAMAVAVKLATAMASALVNVLVPCIYERYPDQGNPIKYGAGQIAVSRHALIISQGAA